MMRPEDIHPVDCQTFEYWCEDTTSPRVDAALTEALKAHQASCERCSEFAVRTRQQRRALHALPVRQVPVNLAVNLRVLASKELARRSARVDWSTRLEAWEGRARLMLNNLWRPLAIPTAGGLASACFLFAALMPTFAVSGQATADVPTAWYQSAEVYGLSPFGGNFDNVTLDVRIDTSGRVIDYAVPTGDAGHWLKNPEMRKAVENSLLFMSFKPASFFGQPASDTIRITLRRSHIEVKG
jgi:anti-sigma factor RsiW